MSTSAVAVGSVRALRFWNTTNGKKAIMAVSGAALFLFVVVHLVGNLQIFRGSDAFNGYAESLRELGGLLWVARGGLLIMVALHIWSTIQLALVKNHARPISYVRYQSSASSYASRSMYMSGPIIAAFVVYHLPQFTFGMGGDAALTRTTLTEM